LLKYHLNFEELGFLIIMFASSANRIGFDVSALMFGRSFIKSKKNKGPSIVPWGAPCFILPHSEKSSIIRKAIIYYFSL